MSTDAPPPAGITHRVWYVPQFPGPAFFVSVSSAVEGQWVLEILTDFSRFEYTNRIKPDYCDTGGVEEWNEEFSKWEEVDE